MKKQWNIVKIFGLLLLSSSLMVGCQKPSDSVKKETDVKTESVGKNGEDFKLDVSDAQEYLAEMFDITFSKEVKKDELETAAKTIFGKDAATIDGDLTGVSLIKYANQLGDYDELTLTYSEKMTKSSLKKAGLATDVDKKYAAYVASSVDAKLLEPELVKELLEVDKLTDEQVAKVMMAAVDVSGKGRNYLGYSYDPNIYRKIEDSFDSFVLFKDKELGAFGAKAVADEVVTGYNMKLNSYNANFLPEKTFVYGHSDIRHAHQLVGLLNREELNVKIQLEPKVSVFQYLLEWGPIPDPLPTYFVEEVGDLHLVNAVEYDLSIEFDNQKDMEHFDQVVEDYAKKYEGNEEGEGLIAESWWQPFYKTDNSKLPKDRFFKVYDSSISNEMYAMHSMVLEEDKEAVAKRFKEMEKNASIDISEKYCNLAFYNYLQGEDYQ